MRTAFLMVTERCNNDCAFCFNRGRAETGRAMTAADIARYAARIRPLGFTDLVLTGGEPLLVDGVETAIGELSAAGWRVLVITNGTLLDRRRTKRLAAARPGGLVWSLNDLYNRRPDADEFLVDLDARLAAYGRAFAGRLSTIFVYTRRTAGLVPRVLAACENAAVPVIVQPAWIRDDHREQTALDPFALPAGEWAQTRAALETWAEDSGAWRYLDYLDTLHGGGDARPHACGMGRDAIVVEPDGTVFPCFHRRDLTAGNLNADAPAAVDERLRDHHRVVADASCFGGHCVSLFVG